VSPRRRRPRLNRNKKPSDNSPFIVGVLGHRDLHPADVPALREAVGAFIGELSVHLLGVRTDGNHSETAIVTLDDADELDPADRLVYWTPTAASTGTPAAADRRPGFLRSVGDNRMLMQRHIPLELARQLAELNNYNREFRRLMAEGRLGIPDSLLASLPADGVRQVPPMEHAVNPLFDRASLQRDRRPACWRFPESTIFTASV